MRNNKKYNRCIMLLCALALFISALGGCANGEDSVKEVITGRWKNGGSYITFYANGIARKNVFDSILYEISGKTLILTQRDDEKETYTVEIVNKNHLVLKEEDNDEFDLYRCDAEGRAIIGE
ncbi:MAG: hypothetical protein ACI3V2_10250 [Faecousia sp.]